MNAERRILYDWVEHRWAKQCSLVKPNAMVLGNILTIAHFRNLVAAFLQGLHLADTQRRVYVVVQTHLQRGKFVWHSDKATASASPRWERSQRACEFKVEALEASGTLRWEKYGTVNRDQYTSVNINQCSKSNIDVDHQPHRFAKFFSTIHDVVIFD